MKTVLQSSTTMFHLSTRAELTKSNFGGKGRVVKVSRKGTLFMFIKKLGVK